MSEKDMSVDPNSVSYMFGQIVQQLEVLNLAQENIYKRLNKQNGQIGDMSKALTANTEVVKGIQCWRRDCEFKEQQEKKAKTQETITVRGAVVGGIVTAVLSAGLTALMFCNYYPLG